MGHDIEARLEIAEDGGLRLPRQVRDAGSLSPYAAEARDPSYQGEITPADIDKAIRVAEGVVIWASLTIGSATRKRAG